ncbi:MAG: YihY family inner membrane protein [Actinobacteria bacterium]|nr:YihY family inner membrane protein [Actinomycetota bacterium]
MSAEAVVGAVEVALPAAQAYDRWTHSPAVPTFLGGTADARPTGVADVDWVALLEGRSHGFDAEVTERVPGSRISWQGRGRPHAGAVSFEDTTPGRSRITVEVDWRPEGGAALADRLILRRQLHEELEVWGPGLATEESPRPASGESPRRAPGETAPQAPGETARDSGDRAAAAPEQSAGVGASSPMKIPARGWMEILKRTFHQVKADNVSLIAAGAAFYVFLALAPALIAVIAVYGLVADPTEVSRQLAPILAALPADAASVVTTQLTAITSGDRSGLGFSLIVSVVVALVGASKGMLAMVTALNIAYDQDETRGFVRLRAMALGLTVAVAVAAVALVGGMVVVRALARPLGTFGEAVVALVRWPVLAALWVMGLAVLYRYAPDRKAPPWRWVTPGALAATVLWLLGSIGLSIYVANFGTYNETYGVLGGVVVLLLWLLFTAYAIVLGAELDREAERQQAGDVGPR